VKGTQSGFVNSLGRTLELGKQCGPSCGYYLICSLDQTSKQRTLLFTHTRKRTPENQMNVFNVVEATCGILPENQPKK
jgi:hypothetical protein